MASRADLINRVADILGMSAAGQELSAEDADLLGKWCTSALDLIAQRGLIYIDDDVPDQVLIPLARMVAVEAAPAAALTRAAVLERLGMTDTQIKTDLIAVIGDGATYQPLRASYF